jgi:cytochrome c oxidase cbb3-type subunit 2
VRRPDFGSDQARGWGERQSVARDYIFQARPQLGASRFGPDLTNLAARKPPYDADDLMNLLYAGTANHPTYKFLFEDRVIAGQRSDRALHLAGAQAPKPGHEIVPTERASSLVAYLQSLNTTYDYPESRPVASAEPAGHEAAKEKAAPTKGGETAAPAKGAEKSAPAKASEKPAAPKEEGKK